MTDPTSLSRAAGKRERKAHVISLLERQGYQIDSPSESSTRLNTHKDGGTTRIEVRSRCTILRDAASDKDTYIAFPDRGDWFIVPHFKLMDIFSHALETDSLKREGGL